jgi:hypothetical protein
LEHDEYDDEETEIELTRVDDDIYDKFSEIIKNYKYGETVDTIPIEEPVAELGMYFTPTYLREALQLPEQVVFQLQGRPVVEGEISLIV